MPDLRSSMFANIYSPIQPLPRIFYPRHTISLQISLSITTIYFLLLILSIATRTLLLIRALVLLRNRRNTLTRWRTNRRNRSLRHEFDPAVWVITSHICILLLLLLWVWLVENLSLTLAVTWRRLHRLQILHRSSLKVGVGGRKALLGLTMPACFAVFMDSNR